MILKFIKNLFNKSTSNTLYIGNLSYKTSKGDLYKLLKKFGTIEKINMVKDKNTNKFKGFCFVTYASAREANQAIKNLNGITFKDRKITIQYTKK